MLTITHLAAVAVSSAAYGYDRRYKYIIPIEMDGKVMTGARVLVPFGTGNRKRVGVVVRIDDSANEDLSKFKPIISVIDNESLLNDEMLDLMMWIRNTTLCTYFDAFRTLIPIGLSVNFTQKYELAEKTELSEDVLSEKALELLNKIRNDISSLNSAENKLVKELVQSGFLVEQDSFKRRTKDETVKMIRLSDDFINGTLKANLSAKQKNIVELLEESGSASVKEITYICGVTSSVIGNMMKKGIVEA
ncbi:MAG: hypothetical protein ACI4KG_07700, partial [Oscillospiraceae bacterium]